MKSPQTALLVLLAGTTVGGALLAWKQYGELVELRAIALNREERADLQKRIWELEKLNRELQEKPAAMPREAGTGAGTAEEDTPGEPGRGGRGGPGGRMEIMQKQAVAMRELMSRPEVQALLNQQQRAAIEGRYAALFRNLNLSPEQAAKLTALLADRGTTMQDLFAAAREQGIDPRTNPEAYRKLVADAQGQINESIKGVIGDQGFAQLANYEQTMPQRNLVNDLQQRLSYTSTPLTPAQAEQLVQILASHAPQRPATTTAGLPMPVETNALMFRAGPGGPGGPGRGPDAGAVFSIAGSPGAGAMLSTLDGLRLGGPPVTDGAIAQAQGVLSAPQVTALQQIQQQQTAQQQLRDLMGKTMQAVAPTGSGDGPPPRKRGG